MPNAMLQKICSVIAPEVRRGAIDVADWANLSSFIGLVRNENQDKIVAASIKKSKQNCLRVLIVSDGMGGMAFGTEAATLAVASVLSHLTLSDDPLPRALRSAAEYANLMVYKEFRGESGATMSIIALNSLGQSLALNVGDSRIYGANIGGKLKQLSIDDNLAALANEGINVDKSHINSGLLQFVGMGQDFEPHTVATSDYELLMASSDGVHWLPQEMLDLVVKNAPNLGVLSRRMIQLAEFGGAHDNATFGVISDNSLNNNHVDSSFTEPELEIWTIGGRFTLFFPDLYTFRKGNYKIGEQLSFPDDDKKRNTAKKKRLPKKTAAKKPEADKDVVEVRFDDSDP